VKQIKNRDQKRERRFIIWLQQILGVELSLKSKVRGCHVDGPSEFFTLGFVVDLFQRNFPFLAPGNRNSWVKVIQFGGA